MPFTFDLLPLCIKKHSLCMSIQLEMDYFVLLNCFRKVKCLYQSSLKSFCCEGKIYKKITMSTYLYIEHPLISLSLFPPHPPKYSGLSTTVIMETLTFLNKLKRILSLKHTDSLKIKAITLGETKAFNLIYASEHYLDFSISFRMYDLTVKRTSLSLTSGSFSMKA